MPETILARIRRERNMTQAQLAEKSGVHIQNISKMERGDKPLSNLRLSTALALADALNVDPHIFLEVTMQNKVMLNGSEVYFDSCVALMDADLREEIHAELAPCEPQEFMDEYVKRHAEKFDGEEFQI